MNFEWTPGTKGLNLFQMQVYLVDAMKKKTLAVVTGYYMK